MLIRALGVTAPAGAVFTSFMIASLFRTMRIVPGGLGTFEATSVLMLRMVGIDVAVALSATLLFRGLSFCLGGQFKTGHLWTGKTGHFRRGRDW